MVTLMCKELHQHSSELLGHEDLEKLIEQLKTFSKVGRRASA